MLRGYSTRMVKRDAGKLPNGERFGHWFANSVTASRSSSFGPTEPRNSINRRDIHISRVCNRPNKNLLFNSGFDVVFLLGNIVNLLRRIIQDFAKNYQQRVSRTFRKISEIFCRWIEDFCKFLNEKIFLREICRFARGKTVAQFCNANAFEKFPFAKLLWFVTVESSKISVL